MIRLNISTASIVWYLYDSTFMEGIKVFSGAHCNREDRCGTIQENKEVASMHTETKVFSYPNGEIQRVEVCRLEDWNELELLKPVPDPGALDCFHRIYRQFLVPAAPWVFGSLVMFRLPEGLQVPFSSEAKGYGHVADPLTAAALGLRRGVWMTGDQPRFRDEVTEKFWKELDSRGCIRIARGKLPITTFIPVRNETGLLTESEIHAQMKVNGSFFVMDPFDCATAHDHVGAYIGLFVKNGKVENPPQYGREALLVRQDGRISVEQMHIRQLPVRIGEDVFIHGENARFYTRPRRGRTPITTGQNIVVIGNRVAAVNRGSTPIPGSGFVICPKKPCDVKPGDPVVYQGLENVRFGIQVGNSTVRNGVPTEKFISKFFNVRGLWRIAYPPSLYPLHYDSDRAARIAIGADGAGKPMILWAEGAAKIGHTPGVDSCGATLSDMARICKEVGMENGVNLDGGGSAQMLISNKRSLMISDRKDQDCSEQERPVPMGLMVR